MRGVKSSVMAMVCVNGEHDGDSVAGVEWRVVQDKLSI